MAPRYHYCSFSVARYKPPGFLAYMLAFCIGLSRLEVPEQTLGGIPLGLVMVMKIHVFEFSCSIGKLE